LEEPFGGGSRIDQTVPVSLRHNGACCIRRVRRFVLPVAYRAAAPAPGVEATPRMGEIIDVIQDLEGTQAPLDRRPANRSPARRDTSASSIRSRFFWLIFRMTNPDHRDLFMGPKNLLRMEEALVSLLAGDLFRRTPIQWSLRAFKILYYINNLAHPWRSFNAWRRRRCAIRDRQDESPAHGLMQQAPLWRRLTGTV